MSTPLTLGRGAGLRPRRVHGRDGAGAVRRDRRPVRRGSTTRPGRSRPCWPSPSATRRRGSATRRGRRTTRRPRASRRGCSRRSAAPDATARCLRLRRASARPDRPAPDEGAAGRDRARGHRKREALDGLERWKARHPDVVAAPGAGRRAGRRDARTQHDVDPDPREPPQRPDEDRPRRRRSRSTTTRGRACGRASRRGPLAMGRRTLRGKGPMLAKLEQTLPNRGRLDLRAEMGRVPVPRDGRGGRRVVRQPRRPADDALLPGGRRDARRVRRRRVRRRRGARARAG